MLIQNLLLVMTLLFGFQGFSQEAEELEASIGNTIKDLAKTSETLLNSGKTASVSVDGIEDKELKELIKSSNLSPNKSHGKIDHFFKEAQAAMVQLLLNQNPFPAMTKEQVRATLQGQIKNQFIKDHPVLIDILTDFFRDKNAISSLVKILFKTDRLKTYSFLVVTLFVLSFVFNLLMDRNSSFFRKLFRRLLVTMTTFILNVLIFYGLFTAEVSPTVKIVWSHLSKLF